MSDMKEQDQRIEIAEATAWHIDVNSPVGRGGSYPWVNKENLRWRVYDAYDLPDYLNDLNAMHEAMKVLTDEQFTAFRYELVEIIGRDNGTGLWCERECYSATARQLAEAFLKAIGKWVEGAE